MIYDFMNACFDGYIEGTELLLRIILNKQDIHVKKVTTQKVMKNLLGRDEPRARESLWNRFAR